MDDSDLELVRRDTNQRTSNGEDTGWRDWSRVFRRRVSTMTSARNHQISGGEATVAELDLRLEEWASADLKSVAADFHHVLTNKEEKDLRPGEHWSTSTSRLAKRVWSGSRDFAHAV